MKNLKLYSVLIFMILAAANPSFSGDEISPYEKNKAYWQYKGKPLLLLGGSNEDNLFQTENLEEELDLLIKCGGNYVRNTLSCRDEGNVWPFIKDEEGGNYDLSKWNEEYWKRLEKFFKLTSEREIIVQMELWATFDFYRNNWEVNPFNPKNNINYTAERTKLPEHVPTHPIFCDNSFFRSVPMLDNNMPVLEYQQKFIDKVLSYSLQYDNILYCIDNETSVSAAWGKFWADYITKIARENGKTIHVTEMWDPHDLNHISHRESFDHPEIYSFVEISQNNHQKGEQHWLNGLKQIERLNSPELKRPVNNVKTYGNDKGKHGHGSQNGRESFIRSIFFGSAASRFHRPNSGLGLSSEAQNVIQSLRIVTDKIDYFDSQVGNYLLRSREPNEAFCRHSGNREYLLFFPVEGGVELVVPEGEYDISWLYIKESSWTKIESRKSDGVIKLSPPEGEFWFAHVLRKTE